MAYITREDGERFIIPSYRDVLSAKKPALLKKEVMLLSTNYGEYITLQRKNIDQYEAAFSPEPGYLLGETVWSYFKRPRDLIYCEAIPNTTEAILVIVKGGSVYLDGSFPVDSIADELIIFRTQQNNFDIYIQGDIPLSQNPEEGKFSLDTSSVNSFTILSEPIFPTLPTIKTFQLRLVDVVLKSQGIGVFPVKKLIIGLAVIALIWFGFLYLSETRKQMPAAFMGSVINPYQLYINTLASSPNPTQEIKSVVTKIQQLYTIPGWVPVSAEYTNGNLIVNEKSLGPKLNVLYEWTSTHNATIQIASDGVYIMFSNLSLNKRINPITISPLQQVLAEMLDRVSTIAPGNNLTLGTTLDRGHFSEAPLSIDFNSLTADLTNKLADQLNGLPLILLKLKMQIQDGLLSGTITLKALGN